MRSCPLFDHPVFDARGYAARAAEMAAGHFATGTVAIHGPGYPAFLAVLSRLSGHDLALMTFANGFLGVGTVLLLWAGTRRILPEAVAVTAAALLAANWVTIHFEGHLLATTWFTFLVTLAYFVLARGEARGPAGAGPAAGPGAARALTTGVVLGLASLTRPNALALIPFAAAWIAFASATATRRRRNALLFLVAVAVVVGPVLVRNHRLSGLWTIQRNAAFNLYLGNHPGSPGYPDVRPGREWDRLVTAPARDGVTTAAGHEEWFRRRVLEFARDDPGAYLRLQGRKLLLFLNHREVRTTLSPYFFRRFAPLQGSPFLVGFGVLGPLALAGLGLAVRRPRPFALPGLFTLPPAALVVLTVMGSRYRAPVLPFLSIFAAHAIVELAGALRSRAWRKGAAIVALLAPAIVVVQLRFEDLETINFAEETARVASIAQERGDLETARRWWEESTREDPTRTETWVSRAALANARRDWRELDVLTAAGLRIRPDDWVLTMFRGRALLELGQPEESLEALRLVLPRRPRDPDLLAGVARAHAAAGRADSSLVWFRRSLPVAGERPEIWHDAAAAFLASARELPAGSARDGLLAEAATALDRGRRVAPEDPRLREMAAELDRLR